MTIGTQDELANVNTCASILPPLSSMAGARPVPVKSRIEGDLISQRIWSLERVESILDGGLTGVLVVSNCRRLTSLPTLRDLWNLRPPQDRQTPAF
jgi:hypothetical protein